MAEKRVKIGKEFEHIPAVKAGCGWLGLERGKFASVYFSKEKQKLEVRKKMEDGKISKRIFAVEDYAKANEAARNANKVGERVGADFGTLRKEEHAALRIWREYVDRKTMEGEAPRSLALVIQHAIEREETNEDTPPFHVVAESFLDYKDKSGAWKGGESYSIASSRLRRLSTVLVDETGKPMKLSEITPFVLEVAIPQAIERKKNGVPAPKTLNHYGKLMKEIFAWWYARANHARPARDQLKNPLELFAPVKTQFLEEPETLPVASARKLLLDMWKHEKKALPAVLFQMFCGTRNAETFRLKWKDIRRDGNERFLYLSKTITKTSMSRSVPIPANLSAWLDALAGEGITQNPEDFIYPAKDERTRKKGVNSALERAQKRTGISKPANAFRHTAVSALCVVHDIFKAASYCGHNVRIQAEFYRAAMSKTDAKDYFGIMPPIGDGKAIAFDRSRIEESESASA